MSRTFKQFIILFLLLELALGLRWFGLDDESFWIDEVASHDYSKLSVPYVLAVSANDVHPPSYFLALYYWRMVFGSSSYMLRSYSALWSVLGLLAIFLWARASSGRKAGYIALLLAAVNPLDVYFAQEARMYCQTATLAALGSWCLWRWMMVAQEEPRARVWAPWAVGYGLCSIAVLYSHYMGVMVLLAQGLFALAWFCRRRRWDCVSAYVLCSVTVAVVFAPWILHVLKFRETFYHIALGWIATPPLSDSVSFVGREFFWGYLDWVHDVAWIPTMLLPGAVVAAALWRRRRRRPGARPHVFAQTRNLGMAYAAWLVFAPGAIAMLSGLLYHPVYYRSRFCMFALPPFIVLCAVSCRVLGRRLRWLAVAALGGVMLAATITQSITAQKPDWRGFSEIWNEREPSAETVFFPNYCQIPAGYSLGIMLTSSERPEIETALPSLGDREIWVCSNRRQQWRLTDKDREYREWLSGLGACESISLSPYLRLDIIRIPASR